jgi:Protein of unknown function (DUF1549)/Protein of unknown function (DUF1553)
MRRRCLTWLAFWALLALGYPAAQVGRADEPKAKPTLPTGTLPAEKWLKYSTERLQPGEIDRLIQAELSTVGAKTAPFITDEQFLRRAFLDVTGKPPTPGDISQYLADKSPDRKAKLIDKLLDSPDYAKHWGRYWRNVVVSRQSDFRAQIFSTNFENWLVKEFQKNRSWGLMVDDMLTATDIIRLDDREKNGQAFFISTRTGADAKTELAAETARIFLGIQIQCAQCHNHPSDIWKRQDFHEFAAYFARVRAQQVQEEKKLAGMKIVSSPFGEHLMPGKDDPKKGTPIQPRFLQGKAPGRSMTDLARRRSLAASITSQDNPWFAGAYVNRIWGELMGQAFVMPIDDMGPEKEVVMPAVLARVAGSFRGSAYNPKQLFKDILMSDVYCRQIRLGESEMFASSAQPTRLQADTLWHSLVATLGPISGGFGGGPKGFGGGFGRGGFGGLEGAFKREFSFDPSTKPSEVEGSISQALMMMNNPQINQKIQAKGESVLGKILAANASDDDALKAVYLRTLSRQPTEREVSRCKAFIATVGNRAEAYEDILWTLVNSTEFQTRR